MGVTVIRTSNRKNAGSRKNKKWRFVPKRSRERMGHEINAINWALRRRIIYPESCVFDNLSKTDLNFKRKADHHKRFHDIRDCFPLAKTS